MLLKTRVVGEGIQARTRAPQRDNDLPGRNWRLTAEIYLLPSSAKLNHSEFDPL